MPTILSLLLLMVAPSCALETYGVPAFLSLQSLTIENQTVAPGDYLIRVTTTPGNSGVNYLSMTGDGQIIFFTTVTAKGTFNAQKIGINTTDPFFDLDVYGIAHVQEDIYAGGSGTFGGPYLLVGADVFSVWQGSVSIGSLLPADDSKLYLKGGGLRIENGGIIITGEDPDNIRNVDIGNTSAGTGAGAAISFETDDNSGFIGALSSTFNIVPQAASHMAINYGNSLILISSATITTGVPLCLTSSGVLGHCTILNISDCGCMPP